MTAIYLVTHTHELDGIEDVKLIGAYSSRIDAQHAVKRRRAFPGFSDNPKGFHIARLELGRDQWSEGFITSPARDESPTKSHKRPKG
jgi:hypothetical protein